MGEGAQLLSRNPKRVELNVIQRSTTLKLLGNILKLSSVNNSYTMSSYRQILYHISFHTRNSEKVLHNSENEELFKYLWGVIKNKKCKLYRINGVEDHIHIICDLHPSCALADLVKDIKVSSSIWIKGRGIYPLFSNWAESYGAFTLSIREKDAVIKYVMNHQEHHKRENFREEFIKLLKENGVDYDEKYLI